MSELISEINDSLGPHSRFVCGIDKWGDKWGGEEAFKIDAKK
jgi:hypothetical protein